MKQLCLFFILFLISNNTLFAQDLQQAKIDSLQREIDRLRYVDRLRTEILQLQTGQKSAEPNSDAGRYDLRRQKRVARANLIAGTLMSLAGASLLSAGLNKENELYDAGPFIYINGGGLLLPGSILMITNIVKLNKLTKKEGGKEVRLEINGTGARIACTF
ncbi:MAG: hypothetical protein J5I59_06630 [Saprospiraceae bacterium]|nr:hypothetical protein [Saprospiraceae bacterium]